MPHKKSKIYTKTGDDGTTGIVGGKRVKKFDRRLEAYGTVDELNSHIGLLLASSLSSEIQNILFEIQNKLFNIGSLLATDDDGYEITSELSITEKNIIFLENSIDLFEEGLPPLNRFILPGGSAEASRCHIARTVCRRAERRILEFAEYERVEPEIVLYMNRLSDFLFVLARKLNVDNGVDEVNWKR